MAVVGDGDDGMFILRERSDGGGEGEVRIDGDGGEIAVKGLVGWVDTIPCRRIESMTSISPFGPYPPSIRAGTSSPACTALHHLLELRAIAKLNKLYLWVNTAFLIAPIQRCDSAGSLICKNHLVHKLSSPIAPLRLVAANLTT